LSTVSAGHAVDAPVQFSCLSQVPFAALHTVPAIAGVVYVHAPATHLSCEQALPSLAQLESFKHATHVPDEQYSVAPVHAVIVGGYEHVPGLPEHNGLKVLLLLPTQSVEGVPLQSALTSQVPQCTVSFASNITSIPYAEHVPEPEHDMKVSL
jgi:hypothetical protein